MRSITSLLTLVVTLQMLSGTALASDGWTWPVRGPVITAYRNGDDPYAAGQHRGVDIGAPVGTRVAAATAGTVTFAGVVGSSGLVVSELTADGRFDLSYLHLSSAAVRRGDSLAAGAPVGAVGTSGRRSVLEPHLHFGVREAGARDAYRDPLDFLAPPPAGEGPDPAPAPVPVAAPAAHDPAPVAAPVAVAASPGPTQLPLPAALEAPGLRLGPGPEQPAPRPHPPAHPAALAPPRGTAVPDQRRRQAPAAAGPRPALLRTPARGPAGSAPAGGTRGAAQMSAGPTASGRRGGLDLGWLAACLGLVVAATALGHPEATRRVARRGRAGIGALLARQ